ncbi:hypothetical protein B0T21DRAFT_345947 [Apiosordaria backusii]|uniref:F-box domain-containing protein n=1 Tax=Apiosordaria backusii TaxID=314023 RepID=A0AA40EMP0_9PEZI|nr:hypothetical protein B0T21DRAFT_345947 [Apiosordaria backusii]
MDNKINHRSHAPSSERGQVQRSSNSSCARSDSAAETFINGEMYNKQYSPLYRVPEEILLMIIRCVEDTVTALCIGQASRRLRRLVHDKLSSGDDEDSDQFLRCLEKEYENLRENSPDDWNILRFLLRQDRLCSSCLRHSELIPQMKKHNSSDKMRLDPLQIRSNGRGPWNGCKFTSRNPTNTLYCAGCDCNHFARQFSTKQRARDDDKRVCVGREGFLRPCKHRKITWADVEKHMLYQANHKHRSGLVPTVRELVCDHASHQPSIPTDDWDTSWAPRLIIKGKSPDDFKVTCTLTRTHRLQLNDCGRLDAQDVWSMFQTDLQKDAGFLITGATANAGIFRAMECFGKSSCTCLTYQSNSTPMNGLLGGFKTCPGWAQYAHFSTLLLYQDGPHNFSNGTEWISVSLGGSGPREDVGGVTVVVTYTREVGSSGSSESRYALQVLKPGRKRATRLNPPHAWLHALDSDSYTLVEDASAVGHVWPVCRNASCGHYYPVHQKTRCPANGSDLKLFRAQLRMKQ